MKKLGLVQKALVEVESRNHQKYSTVDVMYLVFFFSGLLLLCFSAVVFVFFACVCVCVPKQKWNETNM